MVTVETLKKGFQYILVITETSF